MNQEAVEFAQTRAQAIKDLLPQLNEPDNKLLDFGCGNGLFTNYLQTVFFEAKVMGVDQSPLLIAQAREQFEDINFNVIKDDRLPFADNTFDAVIVSLVLHHIDRDKHKHWIKEILRVLKPNGYLIVQELNPFNLFAYIRFKRDPEEKGLAMVNPFYLNRLLRECGARVPRYQCITFAALYSVVWRKVN